MGRKIPPDAFDVYVNLGPSRNYEALAMKYGVTKRAITKAAKRERWQERALELERKAREGTDQKILESLESMNLRHLKSLKVIQGKALEALRSMPLESAMEAVRALDISIRQERVIRGEPGERTAINVEEVVRREYDRWMQVESEIVQETKNTEEKDHEQNGKVQ